MRLRFQVQRPRKPQHLLQMPPPSSNRFGGSHVAAFHRMTTTAATDRETEQDPNEVEERSQLL